jgi:hypothetical protein
LLDTASIGLLRRLAWASRDLPLGLVIGLRSFPVRSVLDSLRGSALCHVLPPMDPMDVSTALIAESVSAALVVVGSRGRGVLRGRLFGSVSRAVVQRAHSAVAVVRPDGAVAPHAIQGRRRASRTTDAASDARPRDD